MMSDAGGPPWLIEMHARESQDPVEKVVVGKVGCGKGELVGTELEGMRDDWGWTECRLRAAPALNTPQTGSQILHM